MKIINRELLTEFALARDCEICGRKVNRCEAHHAVSFRGLGGGQRLDIRENLLSACRECHTKAHALAPGFERERLLEIIGKREQQEPADLQALIFALRRVSKDASGDDVLRVAGDMTLTAAALLLRVVREERERETPVS